mmetsp:Transcript_27973/g.44990  ORF Transcript_27973/g.44990 Transcript_27973/m.44990 type:complete len:279 (+) Transcript_27973:2483-3319(+)
MLRDSRHWTSSHAVSSERLQMAREPSLPTMAKCCGYWRTRLVSPRPSFAASNLKRKVVSARLQKDRQDFATQCHRHLWATRPSPYPCASSTSILLVYVLAGHVFCRWEAAQTRTRPTCHVLKASASFFTRVDTWSLGRVYVPGRRARVLTLPSAAAGGRLSQWSTTATNVSWKCTWMRNSRLARCCKALIWIHLVTSWWARLLKAWAGMTKRAFMDLLPIFKFMTRHSRRMNSKNCIMNLCPYLQMLTPSCKLPFVSLAVACCLRLCVGPWSVPVGVM